MDVRRIIIIAGMLGLAAILFIFMRGLTAPQPAPAPVVTAAPVIQEVEYKDVLVAKQDVSFGRRIGVEDFQWIQWPAETVSDSFITSDARPGAIEELIGTVAQSPIFIGEPVQTRKLIKTVTVLILS